MQKDNYAALRKTPPIFIRNANLYEELHVLVHAYEESKIIESPPHSSHLSLFILFILLSILLLFMIKTGYWYCYYSWFCYYVILLAYNNFSVRYIYRGYT